MGARGWSWRQKVGGQVFKHGEFTYKRWRLAPHRRKTKGVVTLFSNTDKAPFDVNLFSPYFKFTYYCTAKVLGMEASPLTDIVAMVICADIQSKDPRTFDYASYLARAINHGLEKLKGDRVNVNFKYYSPLMHILLYVDQDIWLTQGLSIR